VCCLRSNETAQGKPFYNFSTLGGDSSSSKRVTGEGNPFGDISADMKGLIDFTNNCKLWTNSITNPNYNMLGNNLQQCLNFPGLIYNNFINDSGYHYNTFNFNIFPLSILGNFDANGLNGTPNNVTNQGSTPANVQNNVQNNPNNNPNNQGHNSNNPLNNNVYENLMSMYKKGGNKGSNENKRNDTFKHDESSNNNPFSLNFTLDDYGGAHPTHNEEKEFNNIDFNEKNNYYL
jgi:hypothetical protein